MFLLQSGTTQGLGSLLPTLLLLLLAILLVYFIILYIIRSFKAFSAVLDMKKELQAIHRTLLEQREKF